MDEEEIRAMHRANAEYGERSRRELAEIAAMMPGGVIPKLEPKKTTKEVLAEAREMIAADDARLSGMAVGMFFNDPAYRIKCLRDNRAALVAEIERLRRERNAEPDLAHLVTVCGEPGHCKEEDLVLLCNRWPSHEGKHSWEADAAT